MKAVSAFCLALILTIAVAIAYAVVVSVAYAVWEDYHLRRGPGQQSPNRWETVWISHDGDVMIRISEASISGHDHPGDQFFEIDRQPIAAPSPDSRLQPVALASGRRRLPFNRIGPEARVIPLRQDSGGADDWYLVFEDWPGGHARFEGYDVSRRTLIGYLGPTGFQETLPDDAEMFVIDGAEMANHHGQPLLTWEEFLQIRGAYRLTTIRVDENYPISRDQLVLQANESLYLIELWEQTVEQVLPEERVLSAAVVSQLDPLPDDFVPRGPEEEDDRFILRRFLAVRTPERVIFLHPNDGTRSDFMIPKSLAGRDFDLYLTSDGGAVFTAGAEAGWEQIEPIVMARERDIWWVTADGNVTRQETVTLHQTGRANDLDSLLPLAVPAPLVSLSFSGLLAPWMIHKVKDEPFGVSARDSLAASWRMQLLVILMSAGFAYAAHRHRAAHRLPRSWGWPAFVFLFGLPGFVGYLLHRRWPLRDVVPAPQPTGAEVFA